MKDEKERLEDYKEPFNESFEEVGRRLEKIRKIHNYKTQIEFSKLLGVSKTRYNHWENGGHLPVEMAKLICRFCGVSLDFIYFGDRTALPQKIVEKLSEKL